MRKYQALPAILLLVALGACRGDEVAIELREIQEDVVQFGLQNNTDRAVRSVTMELTYFAADGTPLLVDTTTYRMAEDGSGNEKAFLEAGGETFFVQKSPLRTVSAEARVLKVTYMDE